MRLFVNGICCKFLITLPNIIPVLSYWIDPSEVQSGFSGLTVRKSWLKGKVKFRNDTSETINIFGWIGCKTCKIKILPNEEYVIQKDNWHSVDYYDEDDWIVTQHQQQHPDMWVEPDQGYFTPKDSVPYDVKQAFYRYTGNHPAEYTRHY